MTNSNQDQIRIRYELQCQSRNLNIIAAGGIASFAFGNNNYIDALLILPFISFILFTYYVHQGFALTPSHARNNIKKSFWVFMRRFTHICSTISNFVLIPMGMLLIHTKTKSIDCIKLLDANIIHIIKQLAWIVLIINVLLYILWYYYTYIFVRKNKSE